MGLFRKAEKPATSTAGYRGGCAEHDMHGPVRTTFKAACRDTWGHGRRMHGGPAFYSAYIEGVSVRR